MNLDEEWTPAFCRVTGCFEPPTYWVKSDTGNYDVGLCFGHYREWDQMTAS